MILTEYNEKQHLENVASYYEEQGLKRGEARGEGKAFSILVSLVNSGSISLDEAVELASDLGVKSRSDFCEKADQAGFPLRMKG